MLINLTLADWRAGSSPLTPLGSRQRRHPANLDSFVERGT